MFIGTFSLKRPNNSLKFRTAVENHPVYEIHLVTTIHCLNAKNNVIIVRVNYDYQFLSESNKKIIRNQIATKDICNFFLAISIIIDEFVC